MNCESCLIDPNRACGRALSVDNWPLCEIFPVGADDDFGFLPVYATVFRTIAVFLLFSDPLMFHGRFSSSHTIGFVCRIAEFKLQGWTYALRLKEMTFHLWHPYPNRTETEDFSLTTKYVRSVSEAAWCELFDNGLLCICLDLKSKHRWSKGFVSLDQCFVVNLRKASAFDP